MKESESDEFGYIDILDVNYYAVRYLTWRLYAASANNLKLMLQICNMQPCV